LDLDHHNRVVADGGVVDINSTLDIGIDVNALYQQAGGPTDSLAILTQLLEPLLKLQAGVSLVAADLEPLRMALSSWTAGDRDSLHLASMREALRRVANPTVRLLEATEGTPFAAHLDDALENATKQGAISIGQQYALVFSTLDSEIEALRARRDQLAVSRGVSIRAGAWLRGATADVPAHLDGFDRYAEGDEVIVPRWRINLSERERADLHTSVRLSKALNEGALGPLLGEGFASSVRQLALLAEPCTASLLETVSGFRDQLGQAVEPVKTAATNAAEKLRRLRTTALALKAKYADPSSPSEHDAEALLLATNDDLASIVSGAQDASSALDELRRVARQAATTAALRTVLKPILDWKPEACEQSLRTIRQTGESLATQSLGALGLRHRNNSLLTFGEEVLALDIANVPHQTTLRIPRMGPREPGDVVELRLAVSRAGATAQDLQRARITLRRVLPHVEIAVGLIFARADTTNRPRNVFQTAPSYSVLIKGWPWRSYSNNDLLGFGFGLNLAALDFNHDDAQELGVGFVLSGFLENLLQAGYGYNVKAGAPYAFFGVRLPLPDVGMAKPKAQAAPDD
jgi:hypothetical protein